VVVALAPAVVAVEQAELEEHPVDTVSNIGFCDEEVTLPICHNI